MAFFADFLPTSHVTLVLLGASIIGSILGIVGAIASLRREALLGDSLAHCTLVGVVVAFLVSGQREFAILFFGACLSSLVGLVIIRSLLSIPVIKPDAALAVVLAGFFGLGLVALRYAQVHAVSNRAGLESFIFGKASLMSNPDVIWAFLVGVVVYAVILIVRRYLAVLCFDSSGLIALGPKVAISRYAFTALLLIAVSVALPATGIILTCSLLIIPASIAKLFARSFASYLLLAAVIGGLSGAIGTSASVYVDNMSTGASITLTATTLLLLSLFWISIKRNFINQKRKIV